MIVRRPVKEEREDVKGVQTDGDNEEEDARKKEVPAAKMKSSQGEAITKKTLCGSDCYQCALLYKLTNLSTPM